MGGKSSSSSRQQTTNAQTSTVNDGDYAGASNFTIDESEYNYDYEIDNSLEYEDSRRYDIDNSREDNRRYDIDNSQEIDNSIDDRRSWDYDIDKSQEIDNSYTDESDNSVEDSYNTTLTNDGDFAGVQGDVTILDGGAIGESFDFAKQASEAAAEAVRETASDATAAMNDTAVNTIISAENITKSGFDLSRDYAAGLSEITETFSETLNGVTRDAISNANSAHATNLATVADVAESATTGGQAVVADASVAQVKYIAIAVAVAAAALAVGVKLNG